MSTRGTTYNYFVFSTLLKEERDLKRTKKCPVFMISDLRVGFLRLRLTSNTIKFKNLVVAHSLGDRVGMGGGYGEGGVGRREIMYGCGLR